MHGSRKPGTRERLIETAGDLFYRRGFQSVGLDAVLAEVGISKTAFYKHYESKDDLIVDVLRRRDARDIAEALDYMRRYGGDDPRAQILAFFDHLGEWFRDPSFRGCLFMNAATEFPEPGDPIHRTAAAHSAHLAAEFRRLVASTGAADPDGITRQIMLLMGGAISARHVGGVVDAAESAPAGPALLLYPRANAAAHPAPRGGRGPQPHRRRAGGG